jgi:hypothetical protein
MATEVATPQQPAFWVSPSTHYEGKRITIPFEYQFFSMPRFVKASSREWIQRGVLPLLEIVEEELPLLTKYGVITAASLTTMWSLYAQKKELYKSVITPDGKPNTNHQYVGMDSLMREVYSQYVDLYFNSRRFLYCDMQKIFALEFLQTVELNPEQQELRGKFIEEWRIFETWLNLIRDAEIQARQVYKENHPFTETLTEEEEQKVTEQVSLVDEHEEGDEILPEELREEEKKQVRKEKRQQILNRKNWASFHYDYKQDPEVMKKKPTEAEIPLLTQMERERSLIAQLIDESKKKKEKK